MNSLYDYENLINLVSELLQEYLQSDEKVVE